MYIYMFVGLPVERYGIGLQAMRFEVYVVFIPHLVPLCIRNQNLKSKHEALQHAWKTVR